MRIFAPPRLAVAIAVVCGLALSACGREADAPRWKVAGDAKQGAVIAVRYSCGACHQIPHLEESNGEVGPPLSHFAERTMIAGVLPNTPTNLVRWIQYPQAVVPGNAMPNSGLTDAQARDVAAYLYTLR